MKRVAQQWAAALGVLSLAVCNGAGGDNASAGEPAIITDRTGRQWDVTHARDRYGMDPAFFNFGLGVGAIASVDSPVHVTSGEPGYPRTENLAVFGTNWQQSRRAYAVADLVRHEVFNDRFPGETLNYAAVAY